MKKIQNLSGFIFIVCTVFLAIVSILGVWNILSDNVIEKSGKTIGLLAIVSVIVILAGKFTDSREQAISVDVNGVPLAQPVMQEINPAFSAIRHGTVVLLIIAISLLAFLGVLAIWEVLSGDVLIKSLSSISIVAFAALVIVITCLERENHKLMGQKISGWSVFAVIIIIFWLLGKLF